MSDLTPSTPARRTIPRRQLISTAAAVTVGSTATTAALRTSAFGAVSLPRWSSPATWGADGVPRPGDVVVLTQAVMLDVDVRVGAVHIECGAKLVFDPGKSVSLVSTGNLEVCGVLEMRPTKAAINHLIRFEGIRETEFVGGGMVVLPTDVGLWVHEEGQLDIQGSTRTAWVRSAGSLTPGSRQLKLSAVPLGWRPGDEVVVTPTGSPADMRHFDRFDKSTVQSVRGSVVTLREPLGFGHPAVNVGDGHLLTAEVLNLTRNVTIEGTPGGRTHTTGVHVTRPSSIRYARFRHFGPRQGEGVESLPVLGRYGLHWHMCGDGTRGTVVEGVVMTEGGSHAFVPHESHGIVHRSCITYDTIETPYWWDLPATTRAEAPRSNDTRFEACVAALVKSVPSYRGFRLAGFSLNAGSGNAAVDCVAVGVQGNKDASGFVWPEGSLGLWDFQRSVTHNNACHGIFTWQNSSMPHVVGNFVAFHNGGFGVSHGAYRNGYSYRDAILFGNAKGGVFLHAVSRDDVQISLSDLLIDGAGLSASAVQFGPHIQATSLPTRVLRCRMRGYRTSAVAFNVTGTAAANGIADLVDIVNCTFAGNELWLSSDLTTGSYIRLIRPGGSVGVHPISYGQGKLAPGWNARVEPLKGVQPSGRGARRVAISLPRASGTSSAVGLGRRGR